MTRWPKISQICTEIPISSSLQRNVFGDAGVESSDTVIPLFKRERKTQVTVGPKAYFNHKCAKARVMTEQAFGILKNRWQILQDSYMVLYNLLVETWKDSLTTSEVEGVMNIDERAAGIGDQVANRRRDEVVAEMIRDEVHRDPAFDVNTFEM
ncbi:hypothetical protein LQV05_002212 [Cryptococcus neoformans]|nr:hypothetical protein LQV05_002212 [Cryptococcus neoformans]